MKDEWTKVLDFYRKLDPKSPTESHTGVILIVEFILQSSLGESLRHSISHGALLISRKTPSETREAKRTLRIWNLGCAQAVEICLEEQWQKDHTTFVRTDCVRCRNEDSVGYFQEYLRRL